MGRLLTPRDTKSQSLSVTQLSEGTMLNFDQADSAQVPLVSVGECKIATHSFCQNSCRPLGPYNCRSLINRLGWFSNLVRLHINASMTLTTGTLMRACWPSDSLAPEGQ
jgi:hypothetical protein